MRNLPALLCTTSDLHPTHGIRVRRRDIPNLLRNLPRSSTTPSSQPPIEALLWLLLADELPSAQQLDALVAELAARAALPRDVEALVLSLPPTMHPMTKLSVGILALQPHSAAAAAAAAAPKATRWRHTLEATIHLLAALPRLAGIIYRAGGDSHSGLSRQSLPPSLDFCGRLCAELGITTPPGLDEALPELLRLHLILHADHEGGNASTHAGRLVGSTLADPHLALSAAMGALAGPLHGRASQDVLAFLDGLREELAARGEAIAPEPVRAAIWRTLRAGRVIPGYGHAVLRAPDPRFLAFREYADRLAAAGWDGGPLMRLLDVCREVVPQILREHGRTSNPHPNIDAISGALLHSFGIREREFYTVLFGVGRSFGIAAQLVWDRALGLPIERPKSVTMEWLSERVKEGGPRSRL